MATEKQTAANRANAQKSTGPRTEAGKSRSSLNALKHGCCAQTIILPGEDSKHFHAFTQSYMQDFAPKGALEISLVQELAHTQWTITRIRAHEASLFALGHEKHADAIGTDGDQAIQTAFAGAIVFKAEAPTLKDLGLYLQRQNRMFHNTLKVLRDIQATRKAEDRAEFSRAVEFAYLHQQDKTAFAPELFGFVHSTEEIAPYVHRQTFLATHKKPKIHVTNAA